MKNFAVALENVIDIDEPDPEYWIEYFSAEDVAHVEEQVKNAYPEEEVSILAIRAIPEDKEN